MKRIWVRVEERNVGDLRSRVACRHGFLGFARLQRFHPSGIARVGRSNHRQYWLFRMEIDDRDRHSRCRQALRSHRRQL